MKARLTLLALLMAAPVFALVRPLPDAERQLDAPFVVQVSHTGSMRPALMGGEIVAVVPCAIDKVHVGDVIVYRWLAGECNVIHRVVRIKRTHFGIGLVCRGDANARADRLTVTDKELLGVALLPRGTEVSK